MSDMTAPAGAAGKTPWHFWIVAVLLLLGTAAGAADYVLTRTGNAAYLAMMTETQSAYFTNLPLWQAVLWALGVWLGVVAAILLLLRRGWAAPVLTVSFLCTAAFTIGCMLAPELRADMTAPMTLGGMIVALLISLFFVFYAWAMKKRGVLR